MLAKATIVVLCTALGAGYCQEAAVSKVQLAEPYTGAYSGQDAVGDHVIALWQFDDDEPGKDVSGHGHDLQLKGAQFSEAGKFGGALQSARGYPQEDKPHQAIAKRHADLTPSGAFTVEMWIAADPELEGYPESFLLDNRYVDDTGMQLILSRDTAGARALTMNLGFGSETQGFPSKPLEYKTDEWHHIAFTYDGAGTGTFIIDGAFMGSTTRTGYGSVAPAHKNLMIGDRVGSLYHGFPGRIDQVRLSKGMLEYRAASFDAPVQRMAFVRMEQAPTLKFGVINRLRQAVSGAKVRFALAGLAPRVVELPELASGATHQIQYELDTSLRPDTYELAARITIPGDPGFESTREFAVTIVPRPLPDRMPVVLWGGALDKLDLLKDLGFTHCVGLWADQASIWKAEEPIQAATDEYVATQTQVMDRALSNDIGVVSSLSPGRYADAFEDYLRLDSNGEAYAKKTVDGLHPKVQDFCYNVGASVARTFGDHPAFQAALVHTEVRGATQISYSDVAKEALKQATGLDIPEGLQGPRGTPYQGIDGFPADRVIPDDYPMYVFYKWFWERGDGWNALHTALHKGIKSTGRKDVWTFHDPAVRVASVYGNGGEVDYLSQWTYSYPDPIRIGLATDELFCMAGGSERDDQQVMKMTQIIWYRSQTAPEPGEEAQAQAADFTDHDTNPRGTGTVDATGRYVTAWERLQPHARFITIAPMHLREAFWTKMARPIQGIMYHGWGSLVQLENQHGSYRYTHPETKYELRRLVRSVIEPLGPALMQVPDRPSDVGFVESFASQMFAKRGTYGWNGGWAGDMYHILSYAQLQPRVLYDQTIQQEGLDQFKVLVMADCDVLTESVAQKIKQFQARGGVIIADERLCPAIQPDILIQTHPRDKQADVARTTLMDDAKKLCAELDPHYTRYAYSANPDIVTRVRAYKSTDYLFAVNDLREYGDYVGHHGLAMENGLPADTVLHIARGDGHVYDLVAHRQVRAQLTEGDTAIEAGFGPCEGRVYMVTDRAIDTVRIDAPAQSKPGDTATILVSVLDENGKPIDAVVPMKIELFDPHGRAAEFSGHYGAKDGWVEINVEFAANDVPGLWRVHAEELASGGTADAYVRLQQGA